MNQKGGTKTDTIVKMVLVCFISLFSFSVGTFVGKQFSDSQHRMASLEADYRAPSSASEENEQALTDEDVAALTEEFMKGEKEGEAKRDVASHEEHGEEKHAEGKKETGDVHHAKTKAEHAPTAKGQDKNNNNNAHASKHEAKHAEAVKTNPTQEDDETLAKQMKTIAKLDKITDRVANGKAPTDGHKPEAKTTALPNMVADSTIGKYTVQMASYTTKDEAEGHAVRLKKEGINAYVIPATVNGKSWYRVSAGIYDKREEANNFLQEMKKQNRPGIVQKIIK